MPLELKCNALIENNDFFFTQNDIIAWGVIYFR